MTRCQKGMHPRAWHVEVTLAVCDVCRTAYVPKPAPKRKKKGGKR